MVKITWFILTQFREFERTVVEGAWKPPAVVDEIAFAGIVAVEHAVELRDGLMRLVDDH